MESRRMSDVIRQVDNALHEVAARNNVEAEMLRQQYVLASLYAGPPSPTGNGRTTQRLGQLNSPQLDSGDVLVSLTNVYNPVALRRPRSERDQFYDLDAAINGYISDENFAEENEAANNGTANEMRPNDFASSYPHQPSLRTKMAYKVWLLNKESDTTIWVRRAGVDPPVVGDSSQLPRPRKGQLAIGMPVLVASEQSGESDPISWSRGVVETSSAHETRFGVRLVDSGLFRSNVSLSSLRRLPNALNSPTTSYRVFVDLLPENQRQAITDKTDLCLTVASVTQVSNKWLRSYTAATIEVLSTSSAPKVENREKQESITVEQSKPPVETRPPRRRSRQNKKKTTPPPAAVENRWLKAADERMEKNRKRRDERKKEKERERKNEKHAEKKDTSNNYAYDLYTAQSSSIEDIVI